MEKQKEHHSTMGSYLYMLRIAAGLDRLYPAKLLGYLISGLTLPLVASLLPSAAVALIAEENSVPVYLTAMAAMALLYGAAQFAGQILNSFTGIQEEGVWLRRTVPEYFRKSLTMDYCNLESDRGQLSQSKAYRAAFHVTDSLKFGKSCILNLAGMLVYGGITVALEPLLLPVLLAMFFLHVALYRISVRYYDRMGEVRFRAEQKLRYLSEQAQDARNGKDARIYGMENWFRGSMLDQVGIVNRWLRRYFARDILPEVSDNLFVFLRDILAYAVLVDRFLAGSITAAEFTFFIGLIATFSRWMEGFVREQNGMRNGGFSVEMYRSFLDMEDVFHHGEGEDTGKVKTPPEIVFQDVSFRYPGAEEPVIGHLNLTIRPGERIALVGVNGAGKTTFIKLLCRLYDPTEGEITLNGIDIRKYDYQEYLSLLSVVFQDFCLFSMELGENVAADTKYDEEKVWECLIKAGVEDRVLEMEKGLHTGLYQKEKEGVEISGGEAQKIAIARALYKDAHIVVLDEPTSALDPFSEYEIYRRFDELVEGKTSIYISHRMSSCRFCDEILVFDGGKIAQYGSHEALMEDGEGLYRKMWDAQANYYLAPGAEG